MRRKTLTDNTWEYPKLIGYLEAIFCFISLFNCFDGQRWSLADFYKVGVIWRFMFLRCLWRLALIDTVSFYLDKREEYSACV